MEQCTAVLTRGYGNSLLEYCNPFFALADFLVGIMKWVRMNHDIPDPSANSVVTISFALIH